MAHPTEAGAEAPPGADEGGGAREGTARGEARGARRRSAMPGRGAPSIAVDDEKTNRNLAETNEIDRRSNEIDSAPQGRRRQTDPEPREAEAAALTRACEGSSPFGSTSAPPPRVWGVHVTDVRTAGSSNGKDGGL